MRLEWQIASPTEWKADAVIFLSFEKSVAPLPGLKRWMGDNHPWLASLIGLGDFRGKLHQVAVYYASPEQSIPRVICVGLGPLESFDAEKLRSALASALRKCRELQLSRPALPLSALEGLPLTLSVALKEALIGGMTGLYQFNELKTRDRDEAVYPDHLLLLSETEPGEDCKDSVLYAKTTASAISLTRDLITSPSNRVTPSFLAETARELSDGYGFHLEIMDLDKARELGMGAFAAVAQGSNEPARMIVLEHAPDGTQQDPPLVLVGKGITFDTGGISLKPSEKLDSMKQDMAGAAAVLGAFRILGELSIKRHVVGIIPCTENMPDGKAYKPGDVIRSLSGLTIEVISTDAEGRMVLCDALTYALGFKPAAVVDIATLTGACIVALGDDVGGVMGNHEDLVRKVQEIGMQVGDRLWPLPLWDSYFENIKSDVADFRNVGGRKGGAIIGGIFLKQFIPNEVPWIHLDIAGPAWTEKDVVTAPKGATGFGVRILAELAAKWPEIEKLLALRGTFPIAPSDEHGS